MITPVRHFLLVKLRDVAAPSGAIRVVRLERPTSVRATVTAVGTEVRDLEVGANVVISRLQGIEIGEGVLLLPESAVLATELSDAEAENNGAGENGGLHV